MSDDGAGSPPRAAFGSERPSVSTLGQHPALLSRMVLDHAPMALVALDAQGRVLWCNPGFPGLLGVAEEGLVGRPLTDLARMVSWLPTRHDAGADPAAQPWQRIWLASEGIESSRVVLMSEMLPGPSPLGVARILAFVDLPADQAEECPPFSDPHTGLASQWVFEDRLRHAIERADRHGQQLAVLLIRLDRGERMWRVHGESVMQALLPQVSRRLKGALRREDSITYLGDDRWGVLIEHPVSPESLQAAALRCLDVMEAPFKLGRPPLLLTLSIGIAMYPDDGRSAEQLMGSAGQALSQARPSSHAFFARGVKQMLARRMTLRHGLQEALLRPDQHFDVVYQPLVDLRSGCCVEVEAFVRWRHPRKGILPPDDFMPLVAEMGQMVRLDRWVIEQVIDQHRRWQSVGGSLADLRVSINLDASLLEPSVFDGRPLDRFLREMGGDLGWLSVEVDGRALSEQAEAHGLLLRRLVRMGIRVVADRLGGDHLDLVRLAMLPISRGKVDRELVRALSDSSPYARQALSALSQCLTALSLESIMVGVETVQQLRVARHKGVDQVQGNLLGSPMAAEALVEWLGENAGRVVFPHD
ncbi:MAG: EAL domain-containing protein [Pseudomonadota bacterium]